MELNTDAPIEINVDVSQMLEKYQTIVIEKWSAALIKYGVEATGALMASFIKELQKSGGNVDAVIFKFLKYGRFPDMGVGRGASLNERVLNRKFDRYRNASGKMVGGLSRKKKPWYSKTLYKEVARLSELLTGEYGTQIIKIIEGGLTGSLTLNA